MVNSLCSWIHCQALKATGTHQRLSRKRAVPRGSRPGRPTQSPSAPKCTKAQALMGQRDGWAEVMFVFSCSTFADQARQCTTRSIVCLCQFVNRGRNVSAIGQPFQNLILQDFDHFQYSAPYKLIHTAVFKVARCFLFQLTSGLQR